MWLVAPARGNTRQVENKTWEPGRQTTNGVRASDGISLMVVTFFSTLSLPSYADKSFELVIMGLWLTGQLIPTNNSVDNCL